MAFSPLKAFYNDLITNKHHTGDIWTSLPTHGLLKEPLLPGIVITPACDLSNDKVETISYLPIVPIRKYLATNCFQNEIKNTIINLSDQIKFREVRIVCEITWPPTMHDLDRMKHEIDATFFNGKKKDIGQRILLLLDHIAKIISNRLCYSDMKSLEIGLGKKSLIQF